MQDINVCMLKVIINFIIIFSAFGIKETPAAKPTADGSQLTKNADTNETECSDSQVGITEAEHPGSNAGPSEETEHPDNHDGHPEQSECSGCCAPAEQTDLSGSNVPAKQIGLPTGHHTTAKQAKSPGSRGSGEQTECPGSSSEPAEQSEHSGGRVHVSKEQTEGPGSNVPGEQIAQVERRHSRTPMTLDDSGISIEGD